MKQSKSQKRLEDRIKDFESSKLGNGFKKPGSQSGRK